MVKGRTRGERERKTDRREGGGGDWTPLVARAFVRRTRVVRVRWIQSSVNCLAARPAILSGLDYKVFHSELIAPRHLRWCRGRRMRRRRKPCRHPRGGERGRTSLCPHCCPQQSSRISFHRSFLSFLWHGTLKRFGSDEKEARDTRA